MPLPLPSLAPPFSVRFVGALALACTLLMPAMANADEWTDVSGVHTLSADFLGIWGDKAVFAMPDGQRKSVLLKNLQAESRLRAMDMAEQRKAHLQKVKSELEALQAAERAPAADRIEGPQTNAAEYQPLAQDASLQETLDHQLKQIRAGHPRVMWDSLPKSYQQDIEALVVEFGGKMDAQVWNQQIATLDRVSRLLASREEWIFSHPQFSAIVASVTNDETAARANYRALIGLVQSVADPEKISLERLKQGNVGTLIAELDGRAAGYLQPFAPIIDASLPTSVVANMVDDTHGSVIIEQPTAPQAPPPNGPAAMQAPGMQAPGMQAPGMQGPGMQATQKQGTPIKMIQVEGRWVSESMADTWKKDIEDMRTKIAEITTTVANYRFMIDALGQWVNLNLSPLESADSREAFHSAMNPVVADVSMLFSQWLSQPRNPNNSNNPGYGNSAGYENAGGYDSADGYDSGADYEASMTSPMEGPRMQGAGPPPN